MNFLIASKPKYTKWLKVLFCLFSSPPHLFPVSLCPSVCVQVQQIDRVVEVVDEAVKGECNPSDHRPPHIYTQIDQGC